MTLRCLMLAAAVVVAAACENLPTAATPVAGPTPPVAAPPLPTTVPGVLSVTLPVSSNDAAATAFGLAPFGYHGVDHGEDGHPGWDVEYRPGGAVRAAAAGTVQAVLPDASAGGRSSVQIEHLVGAHYYRTTYTNVASVDDAVVAGAAVQPGQVLGMAGTLSQVVGRIPLIYAMSHFQIDDLEFHREGPDPKAVSPEPFLSADGRALFDRVWAGAHYVHELVEPYASNPRDLTFPASRTWTRAGGDGPPGIRFTRRTARAAEYEFALLAESGTVIETGTVSLNVTARPNPTIDLFSPTAIRLGVYDIVSNEMRLTLANPGEARPAALDPTSIYRTTR